jgi:hypothetical protein
MLAREGSAEKAVESIVVTVGGSVTDVSEGSLEAKFGAMEVKGPSMISELSDKAL